jgi:hypothetical protein
MGLGELNGKTKWVFGSLVAAAALALSFTAGVFAHGSTVGRLQSAIEDQNDHIEALRIEVSKISGALKEHANDTTRHENADQKTKRIITLFKELVKPELNAINREMSEIRTDIRYLRQQHDNERGSMR